MVKERSKTDRPDLYIGLVGAAGTDLSEVRNQLQAQLSVVNYGFEVVKVSSLIADVVGVAPQLDEFERIRALMEAGDQMRQCSDNAQGVAAAVVAELRRIRGEDQELPSSTAYVIDSLKNPAEVDLFDRIYGRNYYTISVYLPKEERIENLKNKIAKGRHEPPDDIHAGLADELVEDDERSTDKKAQNVGDTFPKADYFVNLKEDVPAQVKRFVELIFGEPFTTPSPDEYFMFLAKATALRSCDLSRQVGAVIVGDLYRCVTQLQVPPSFCVPERDDTNSDREYRHRADYRQDDPEEDPLREH